MSGAQAYDSVLQNVTIPNDEELKTLVERLVIIAEDYDGEDEFDMEKAAYGYIDPWMKLIIPKSMEARMPTTLVDQIDLNILEVYTILFWNFFRLKKGGMDEKSAFFVAAYRARLVRLGYLYKTKEDRCVTVDEVEYLSGAKDFYKESYETESKFKEALGDNPAPTKMISVYVAHGKAKEFKQFLIYCMKPERAPILKYLVFSASQYAAATYLVFRQHGHHYQTELRTKYEILWKATTIQVNKDWAIPEPDYIHRVAIHPFGVKVLHEKFFMLKARNKLAETFVDRSDVAPCGAALVSTCYAAVNLLKSLPIWDTIYASYKSQIDDLTNEAKKLSNSETAIQYHKNARMFGVMRKRINVEVASALAPIAKGFINSLGTDADLSKQKTLDKRANQNPVVVDTINKIITKTMKASVAEGDISTMAIRQSATAKSMKRIEGPGGKKKEAKGDKEEETDEEEESDEGGT
jgi:hypothetical protein